MFKDGKYKLHKDGHEYEAVITTLSVYDGFYSKTSDVQFVCIPGHFPIPLDSWLLEDFVMILDDAVEHRLHTDAAKSSAKTDLFKHVSVSGKQKSKSRRAGKA